MALLLSVLLGLGRYYESQWVASLIFAFWVVTQLIVNERLARAFGAGPGYAAGLVLIPIVAYPLLMMDGKVYLGPVDGIGA